MKFRISRIYKKEGLLTSKNGSKSRSKGKLVAHRSSFHGTAPVKSNRSLKEEILFYSLFETASLEPPPKQKKRRRHAVLKRFRSVLSGARLVILKVLLAVGKAVASVADRIAPHSRPRSIHMLLGALCSAVIITLFSALVLGSALLARYFLPYEEFIVPDLVGVSYASAESLYSDRVEFDISYIYSADHEEGTVIGQYPSGGVIKKQYGSTPLTKMSVKVSRGARTIKIDGLVGTRERDALIALKKNEIIAKVIEEYSDTVDAGLIISASPSGISIKEGDTVTLTVSLGKKTVYASVPDLYGLTESGACAALKDRGFRIGSILYEASSLPFGRVISQDPAPFAELEADTEISFTVSAGETFLPRLVPDLYGSTRDKAEQLLKNAGLVIGNVYSVSSGAPSGTVVAQSPPPSSPITSSITSIDLYISS